MAGPICDFCNAEPPTDRVPTQAFYVMGAWSADDWLACPTCARLIRFNQWSLLLRRVMESWQKQHAEPMSPIVSETLRLTYEKLREHITGPLTKL